MMWLLWNPTGVLPHASTDEIHTQSWASSAKEANVGKDNSPNRLLRNSVRNNDLSFK